MPFGAFSERGEILYIQPNWAREEPPLQIPENYSGTAMKPHPPIHIPTPGKEEAIPPGDNAVSEIETDTETALSAPETPVPAGESSGLRFAMPTPEYRPTDVTDRPEKSVDPGVPFLEKRQTAKEETATPGGDTREPRPDGRDAPGEDCAPAGAGAHGDAQSVFRKMPPPRRGDGSHGGLFTRFPFLTSLLPPKHHGAPPSSDLALVVGVFLLLSDNKEDDVLPLLLLLLLA